MLALIESTSREMVDVKVVPDLLQVIALRARLEDLDGVPVININDVPLQGVNSAVKRAIDIVISASALAVLAVPLGLVALRGPAHLARLGVLPPGTDGARRQVVHDRQVPLDVQRRRARDRAGLGEGTTTRG